MSDPVFPRVDEIAPYLPPDQSYAMLAVELATARWENAQLRALLKIESDAVEEAET